MNAKERKKNRRINNAMVVVLLLLSIVSTVLIGISMFKSADAQEGEGEKETLSIDVDKAYNELYTIGNNPTEVQQEYFRELSEALDAGDQEAAARAVVKSFVSDYYTWSNKDGNYEIGGMEYIYGPLKDNFAQYSRWNFYADMNEYLKQYGRGELLTVGSVTIKEAVGISYTYTPAVSDTTEESEENTETEGSEVSFNGYRITAEWTYANSTMNKEGFQTEGVFTVVDHDGRYEIIAVHAGE